jgi:hypothetical protein
MQRRHFEFIASVLRDLEHEPAIDQSTLQAIVREFSRQLKRTNAGFDADRFIRAATDKI